MNISSGSVLDPMYRDLNINNRKLRSNENKSTNSNRYIKFEFPKSDAETSSENSESSESESEDLEIGDTALAESSDLRTETWFREAIPRKDGSRIDIYYKHEGSNRRLRSNNEVIEYCNLNNIIYNPNLFNFSGKFNYSGIVNEENLFFINEDEFKNKA